MHMPQCPYMRLKTNIIHILYPLLLGPFPYFGSAYLVLIIHLSPVLCFFYLYSFLLLVFSYNITPHQSRSSSLSVSIHFHVLITTSSLVFLSAWPNHLGLASLICSGMIATPALVLIGSFLVFSILFITQHPYKQSHNIIICATLSFARPAERRDAMHQGDMSERRLDDRWHHCHYHRR